jgi:rubrerythrin
MFTLKDIIALAIQIEKNGKEVYRRALENTTDPALISLLQDLASQEAQHAEWLSGLEQQGNTVVSDPQVEKAGRALLNRILGDQTFSLAEVDLSRMESVEALLARALEFEKDTALFYEMIHSFVEDEHVLKQLDTIISEEYRHAEALKTCLEKTREKHDVRQDA